MASLTTDERNQTYPVSWNMACQPDRLPLEPTKMLVVIDPQVEAYQMLIAAVPRGTNVLILDPNQDSIEQITATLASGTTESLHIVCHGAPGSLDLARTRLNGLNVEDYTHQLQQWKVAEIFLYACHVAADGISLPTHSTSSVGYSFLHRLHQLTGANIAASAQRIGNAAQGGHWRLEYHIGQISTELAFAPAMRQMYPGVLALLEPATNVGVGTRPDDMAVGDFNGDGNLDLAVTNRDDNNVSVLLGNGIGGFSNPTNFRVGNTPRAITVADLNRDGNQDLVVVNIFGLADDVSILLGDGTGNFASAINVAVGGFSHDVAVGDYNGDNNLDLAVTDFNGDNVSVLLGDGTGNFGSATRFSVGSNPEGVVTGDFNGDGNLDLAVANAVSDNISILLGNGTGNFGAATNFGVGEFPAFLTVGDFDGDTNLDLATANLQSNTISVLLGDGTGNFRTATNFSVGSDPVGITVEDFDGDNNLDLVVANRSSDSVSVLLGDGTGGFGAATNFGTGNAPQNVAVGDFDNDGDSDLAVTNSLDNNVSILLNTTIESDPLVTIAPNTPPTEANSTPGIFTITLSKAAPVGGLMVNFTETGTATKLDDYSLAAGTNITALTANSFTIASGETTATLEVTPVNDTISDPDETVELTLVTGSNYIIGSVNQANLTITDNDSPGVTLTPPINNINVAEGGNSNTYDVVLNTIPTAAVAITIEADNQVDLGAGVGNPITLNFAADATALTPQTITVTAVDDAEVEGTHTSTITHTAASSDPNYNGIVIANRIVNITDNDSPGVTITPSEESTDIAEAGDSDIYQVVLNTIPTAAVAITIEADDEVDLGAGVGNPITLNFAADATALTPQTITVTAVDDAEVEGTHTSTITHTAASSDPNYNGIVIPNLSATIADNDVDHPETPITPTDPGDVPVALNLNHQQNTFLIEGNPLQPANLQFTLTQNRANFINEIGIFMINDLDGGIDLNGDGQTDINPSDPDYITQALTQGQVIFSALPDDFVANPTRILSGLNGGDRFAFYLVSNSTTDAVLAGQTAPNQVLLSSNFDTNGFEPLQVSPGSNNEFSLQWEDVPGGGDQDFNDVVMTFGLTPESTPPAAQLQGSRQGELIDLRGIDLDHDGQTDSELRISFVVNSEAAFDNFVGFYHVDDRDGRIGNLLPGQTGYAQAAIERRVISFNRQGTDPVQLSGDQLGLLAPYLIANGTPEEFLNTNPDNLQGEHPLAYFNYLGANPDGVDHVRLLADNTFGFEDLFGGGDADFNDLVVQINLSSI